MKTRLLVLGVVLALLVSFGVGASPAQAAGTASVSVGCSQIIISGTTDDPYYIDGDPIVLVVIGYSSDEIIYFGLVPVDAGGHFNFTYNVPVGAKAGDLFYIMVDDNSGEIVQLNQQPCTVASALFQGPPIPAGFVLKTVTCDVAVFDTPGGQPVGSNAITGGQTWYVDPTPKKDAAGKEWTEIFVAGYSNGFVPTSCVH